MTIVETRSQQDLHAVFGSSRRACGVEAAEASAASGLIPSSDGMVVWAWAYVCRPWVFQHAARSLLLRFLYTLGLLAHMLLLAVTIAIAVTITTGTFATTPCLVIITTTTTTSTTTIAPALLLVVPRQQLVLEQLLPLAIAEPCLGGVWESPIQKKRSGR